MLHNSIGPRVRVNRPRVPGGFFSYDMTRGNAFAFSGGYRSEADAVTAAGALSRRVYGCAPVFVAEIG